MMLAVRRAGVTEGTQKLEGKGFLKAAMGQITITDRDRLRKFAGGSYGLPKRNMSVSSADDPIGAATVLADA